MRYLPLLIVALLFTIPATGQVWLDIAPKVSIGLSGFYNSNVWNDLDHAAQLNPGYGYGAKLGLNFGDYNVLIFEGMMNHGNQNFKHLLYGQFFSGIFDNLTTWQTIDASLIYRHNAYGAYLEIGPQMNMIRSVIQSYNNDIFDKSRSFYRDRYFSAVAGFGGFIAGNDFFTLVMGIRFGYSFTDMMNINARNVLAPPPAGYQVFDEYTGSYPYFAQIQMEFSFGIGRAAKAAYGRRIHLYNYLVS